MKKIKSKKIDRVEITRWGVEFLTIAGPLGYLMNSIYLYGDNYIYDARGKLKSRF